MVLLDLHLLSLTPSITPSHLLQTLHAQLPQGAKVVFQARVLRWMVLPAHTSAPRLLGRNIHWDLVVGILRPSSSSDKDWIPFPLRTDAGLVAERWSVSSGVSAKAVEGYQRLNDQLYAPGTAGESVPTSDIPSITKVGKGDFFLDAESGEWTQWLSSSSRGAAVRDRPVSMLNLLKFRPGKETHESYKRYGEEFSKRVGAKYGGRVKIVGRVVGSPAVPDGEQKDGGVGTADEDGWHEIAWVHYPSARHFAAMAASEEYKQVNLEHRVKALEDTFILCCQEVGVDGEWVGGKGQGGSKL
ncbi:hypothetical protein VTJ04DRAFT_6891 [Mycothermus thermophilus]|uniref:uncharacterized protein n=1 Tax=Humicola insolens TaxID=85995 RepID=UPI0037444700